MLYYQAKLDKLFADNKVTVVMSGHTHVTQRHGVNYQGFKTMNATVVNGKAVYQNPTAPVFLSVGFAGAGGDLPTPGQAGADFTDWQSNRPAYIRVSVDTDTMTVDFVDALLGTVLDTSVIQITLPSGAYAAVQVPVCPVVNKPYLSDLRNLPSPTGKNRIIKTFQFPSTMMVIAPLYPQSPVFHITISLFTDQKVCPCRRLDRVG